MPFLDDIAAEIRAVESWAARNERADSAAAAFSPRQAENMAMAARMWPGMSPGALLALGHGNYRPDHPVAMQLAELSERERMRNHPYGAQYGQPSITKAMGTDAARLLNQQSTAQRQAQYQARRDAMSPQAQRMEEAEHGMGAPHSANPIEAAIARGILTDDGKVVRVSTPRYRDGEWSFDDSFGEENDRLFNEVMTFLGQQQGSDDPIPFTVASGPEKGETGLFHPKTGNTEIVRPRDIPAMTGFPGPIDDFLEQSKAKVSELLTERRFPDPFGAQAQAPVGQTSTAGFTSPKDVIRGGFMSLDMPLQELQGQVRNLYALSHGEPTNFWETQSDLGIQLTTGKDPGQGFFIDQESEVAAERRRREAERGMIGDSLVTLGRWAADALTPFDPDTKPAMILSGLADAAVAIKGDPSAFLLGASGKYLRNRQVFAASTPEEAAGVINGLRKVTSQIDGVKFLDTDMADTGGFQHVWADTDSTFDIWRMSNRKLPIRMAREIAEEAHTPEEVRAIVEPAIGSRIRTTDTLGTQFGRSATSPMAPTARPTTMPIRGKLDAHTQDLVAHEIESFLHNIPTATDDDIGEAIARIARAENPVALNRAIRNSMSDADGLLAKAGIEDPTLRKTLTGLHADTHEEVQRTFVESITHQGPTDNPLMLAGEDHYYAGAHLITEMAPQYVTLGDARVIRRLTSEMPTLFKKSISTPEGELRWPLAALEGLQNQIWKPLQLMRMAWTVRVIGEEQIRMAAAGYDSMFNHPLSFISWRVGQKGNTDILGSMLDTANQFKAAMSGANGGWVDRAIVQTGKKTTYYKDDIANRAKFATSWGSEAIRLYADPVANYVANADTLDDAVEWFTRGAGNQFRGQLAVAKPGQFEDLDSARSYIETVQRRIDNATGGNADLLDAIRTGKLDGTDLMAGASQNPELAARLDSLVDEFAPTKMIGEETITVANKGIADRWNRGVDQMFSVLMTNRTNNLSRSPTFKQEYYREVEHLLSAADPTVRQTIIDAAQEAGISGRALKRLNGTQSTGQLSIEEIDYLAKGRALDETKNLLYDLTRKGRFMDAARLIFPFGEAWSEVLTRWVGPKGLIRNNPKTVRRFQQTIQAARGEDFGEIMTGEPGGFFTTNEFGEEVFTYPGSRLLTDKLLGVPIPLTGSVQGLSMFGTIMPGLGPVIQMPVAALIEQKPGPQAVKELLGTLETAELPVLGTTVKEQIVPFGSPAALDQGQALNVYNFLPAWMRTALNAAFNDDVGATQTFGNTQLSMAAYLRSTGRYGNSRADQQQLMEDAAFKARNFTIIKALTQTTAPSSPSPDWLLEANGKQVRARALAEEYQKLQDDDFQTADQTFYERYGEDVLAAVQPKTRAAIYGLPVTREGAQWVMRNPGIEDRLPNTYGLFAPEGDPDEFDYTLYQSQVISGDRQILDLKTYTRLMNDTKADLLYSRAIEMAGDDNSREMTAWLREVRGRIHDEYPGWQDETGLIGKADTDTLVRELYEAADDPAIRDTEAGKGLVLYLEGRDRALAEAESRDRAGFQTSDDTDDLRIWLNDVATRIIDKYPAFKSPWDFVLSREVEVTDDGTP